MTIVVGAKFKTPAGDQVYIGSDSSICDDSDGSRFLNVVDPYKLISFKRFTVGMAGDFTLKQILSDMANEEDEKNKHTRITNARSAYNFGQKVFAEMKSKSVRTDDENEKHADPGGEIMIATKTQLFCYSPLDRAIYEISSFAALGSGSAWAMGNLEAIYECDIVDPDTRECIVEDAVAAACKYSYECSLPSKVVKV